MPLLRVLGLAALAPFSVPSWPYPGLGPKAPPSPPADVVTVPGSSVRLARSATQNPYSPPDWFPAAHGAMPSIVARGRDRKLYACGYCHLPDGSGRPENANITGLSAAYVAREILAFAAGQRHSAAGADLAPLKTMRAEASALHPDEIASAAAYFSSMPRRSKVQVVEGQTVRPFRERAYIYELQPGGPDAPLGDRIVEVAASMDRHEIRDPGVNYRAYVPPGSIARGGQLAHFGPAGPPTACFVCHGPALQGTAVAPPLAGQFPTVIVRQLLAFRTGTRSGPEAALMQPVVATLTVDDMIALAAYAGSRPP